MFRAPRWRFPAALLLGGLLLLSACGGNQAPTAPTSDPAPAATSATSGVGENQSGFKFDPTTYAKNEVDPGAQLRVSTWGDASEQQVTRDSLKRFNQVYPDVKVNYEPVPSDYEAKLLAQVSSDTEPDVFYLDVNLPYQLTPYSVLMGP